MALFSEQFLQNLLTITILVWIAFAIYLKMSNKSFLDFIKEIREAFGNAPEVIHETVTTNPYAKIR